MPHRKVVFIMGLGHSGSTLLELILGSHSHIMGLGEVTQLREKIDRGDGAEPALCSICTGPCPYWNGRADIDTLKRYFSQGTPWDSLVRQISRFRRSIYHSLFEWFEVPMLVDSSKRPTWIRRQIFPRYTWRDIEPVLLYVTRDGRGIINSHLRKYPQYKIRDAAHHFVENARRMNDFYRRFDGLKYVLSYEELTTDPASTVSALMRFLDAGYEPAMLNYWMHDHHPCGGNLGTRSLIFRYRSEYGSTAEPWQHSQSQLKANHGDYYDTVGLAITQDLRWQRELKAEQLRIFESIAGETNRQFARLDALEGQAFPAPVLRKTRTVTSVNAGTWERPSVARRR